MPQQTCQGIPERSQTCQVSVLLNNLHMGKAYCICLSVYIEISDGFLEKQWKSEPINNIFASIA